jgi:hypothetical protein
MSRRHAVTHDQTASRVLTSSDDDDEYHHPLPSLHTQQQQNQQPLQQHQQLGQLQRAVTPTDSRSSYDANDTYTNEHAAPPIHTSIGGHGSGGGESGDELVEIPSEPPSPLTFGQSVPLTPPATPLPMRRRYAPNPQTNSVPTSTRPGSSSGYYNAYIPMTPHGRSTTVSGVATVGLTTINMSNTNNYGGGRGSAAGALGSPSSISHVGMIPSPNEESIGAARAPTPTSLSASASGATGSWPIPLPHSNSFRSISATASAAVTPTASMGPRRLSGNAIASALSPTSLQSGQLHAGPGLVGGTTAQYTSTSAFTRRAIATRSSAVALSRTSSQGYPSQHIPSSSASGGGGGSSSSGYGPPMRPHRSQYSQHTRGSGHHYGGHSGNEGRMTSSMRRVQSATDFAATGSHRHYGSHGSSGHAGGTSHGNSKDGSASRTFEHQLHMTFVNQKLKVINSGGCGSSNYRSLLID